MSDAWKSYKGAPPVGTVLCPEADVPDAGTISLDVDGFPILVVQVRGRLLAYVNACPHQYLPLDHRGDKLMSADGTILRCTNHAAGFSIDTGAGVEGLGIGSCLDPVPVQLIAGKVVIGPA